MDGWEDFSVKVVPSVDSSESVPQDGTAGVSEHSVPEALQQEEQDLFEDMKPVFQKPKKVVRMGMPLQSLLLILMLYSISIDSHTQQHRGAA